MRFLLFIVGLLYAIPAIRSLWLVLDSAAAAFTWLDVRDPIGAWSLVGVLFGALIGLAIGLHRAGRPIPTGTVRLVGIALLAGLLVAGGTASTASGATRAGASSARLPAGPLAVRVLGDKLTVRAAPNTSARVLGTVPPNTVLTYIRQTESGAWYQVSVRGRNGPVLGWISSRLVSPPH